MRTAEAAAAAPTARRAHPLVADLFAPRAAIYYADLLASAGLAWGALWLASRAPSGPTALSLFALGALALYRAASFIHELTHLHPGAVPGFATAWNLLVGLPLLLPSFLYVGVHGAHHARTRYGTARDPEYLPLAGWPRWRIALFVLQAAALPLALAVRFLLIAPLSLLSPRLRAFAWARASALAINPGYRRPPPPPPLRRSFLLLEAACTAWAIALALLLATGAVAPRFPLAVALAASLAGLVNQLRTCAAHRFRNAGEPMTFEEQFRDSVDITGPSLPSALWAPVGLRFHGLHHLLPGLPYHALGEARRRLAAAVPTEAALAVVAERTLLAALRALAAVPR